MRRRNEGIGQKKIFFTKFDKMCTSFDFWDADVAVADGVVADLGDASQLFPLLPQPPSPALPHSQSFSCFGLALFADEAMGQ
jgi:hypothetical protein